MWWVIDDGPMGLHAEKEPVRRVRLYRAVSEKRRVVERILEGGRSVAQVAREEGVNTNQLHRWRREYLAGLLPSEDTSTPHLLPVQVESADAEEVESSAIMAVNSSVSSVEVRGCIHIEIYPARTAITAEHGADPVLLRTTLEALRH